MLHTFGNGYDGFSPTGALINVKGTLYGTTPVGGAYGRGTNICYGGCGTVYSISTRGNEKVLHSFGRGSDAKQPFAGLIEVKGTLYGTTAGGGTNGYGTVFALTL